METLFDGGIAAVTPISLPHRCSQDIAAESIQVVSDLVCINKNISGNRIGRNNAKSDPAKNED